MVIGIIGENCSGKSTLANELSKLIGAEIFTGKDYLRLAKSENEAVPLFRKMLEDAIQGKHVIYVISEKEHLTFLPDGAMKIYVKASLETIRERFKARMHGNLPAPVAQMLERRNGLFDDGCYDYEYNSETGDCTSFCFLLKERLQ